MSWHGRKKEKHRRQPSSFQISTFLAQVRTIRGLVIREGKGFEMMTKDTARRMFRDVAIALLVVGYVACPIHGFVSCEMSGALATGQIVISVLVALPAMRFRCWGIMSAAVGLCLLAPMFCH